MQQNNNNGTNKIPYYSYILEFILAKLNYCDTENGS